MARPKTDPGKRLAHRAGTRFTLAEWSAVVEAARAEGLTPAALIRSLTLRGLDIPTPRHSRFRPRAVDPDLLREINAIGRNLNQSVKAVHQGQLDHNLGDQLREVAAILITVREATS